MLFSRRFLQRTAAVSAPPTFCLTLAEAHAALSADLRRSLEAAPPASLAQTVALTRSWWRRAASLLLPRDLGELEDLPLLLLEAARSAQRSHNRFLTMADDAILAEFEEWCESYAPADARWVSYDVLAGLLQSYLRYHEGERWGASAGEEGPTASYHRRAYWLHPWHGVYCPHGRTLQQPYVHALLWMLAKGTAAQDGGDLWRVHRALQPFGAPRGTFAALDVSSGSGHAVELLLKAGAATVAAADPEAEALGNVEATVREHLRERRSGGGQKRVNVLQCELLPDTGRHAPPRAEVSEGKSAATVFADAATRRRQQARQLGRALDAARPSASEEEPGPAVGPYDVLWYHPPPPPLWPMAALRRAPPHRAAWWRQAGRAPLPWVMAPAAATGAAGHPHSSLHALQQLVASLRADVVQRTVAPPPQWAGDPPERALLQEDGYAVLLLPRTFDLDDVLYDSSAADRTALSDWVVAQLDGHYDVVLRKRFPLGKEADDAVQAQLAFLRHLRPDGADAPGAAETELLAYYRRHMWTDLLVLQKSRRAAQLSAAARYPPAGTGTPDQQRTYAELARLVAALDRRPTAAVTSADGDTVCGVRWEDSFEFNEYKPKTANSTRYHWTDLVPTYSYLEDTFYDKKEEVVKNFLAVGHPPQLQRPHSPSDSPADTAAPPPATAAPTASRRAAEEAAAAFRSIFAEELRHKRRSKLRKLALSPLEQQEWYIDKKLIRSEGAKVEFMNELSRWDLKDYDE